MTMFRRDRTLALTLGLASLTLAAPRTLAQASAKPAAKAAAKSQTATTDTAPPTTLSSPATPAKAPGLDGFIQRWILLEPIPATGLTQAAVQAEVNKPYFPGQFEVLPHNGDRVTVDGHDLLWHAVETRNYNINLYHFARSLQKPTSDVLFWAVTIVNLPQEMHDVRLAIGSNAASVWWVNGQEVIDIYGDRQTVIDDGVSRRLTLKKGPNVIRVAVINGGGATDFCARLLDPHDKPLRNYTITLPTTNAR